MPANRAPVQPAFLAWAAAGFGAEIIRIQPADYNGPSPGKRPMDDSWPDLTITSEMLTAWSRQDVNVGLRTSMFPAVDIDVDDAGVADAIERVLVACLGQGARRTRSNSARRALLYRLAGDPFKKRAIKFQLPSGALAKVEVLADGQQLVVAGMHPSGVPNDWLDGVPVASKLPSMRAEQQDELIAMLRVRLAGLGCNLFDKPAAQAPVVAARRVPQPTGDKGRRAAAYVAKMGPSVEGNGGDDHGFRVAATLVRDFAVSEDEAWSLLCDWNTTCLPPWPETDLRRFLRSALKNGTHDHGSKLADRPMSTQRAAPPVSPDDMDAIFEADPGDSEPDGPADVLAEARDVAERANAPKRAREQTAGKARETAEEPRRATDAELLGLGPRPCSTEALRERQVLRFVSLAELPEAHGWGEFLDKLTGGGLAPGSIVGLGAAGTGAGKTAFLMQLLDGLAMRSSFTAEREENTAPLTPIVVLSEMAAVDLEARTLGRLLDTPGSVFLAGRSAKRWHPWAWVDERYEQAAQLMRPGALFARIAAWQRVARPKVYGPALTETVESYVAAWVDEIRARYPGHEVVPIIAIDPINRFLPLDGRSEVETLGELASSLDALADRRRWIVLVTADTNKNAARDPSQAATGAAVFRGTMQLLHAFDLTLVFEPGDSDADGVRDYGVRLDKNRYGRADVSLNFRWHTRTGLRFVPESEAEWKARSGEANLKLHDDSVERARIVEKVAALAAAGVVVTRRNLRPHAPELGVTKDAIEALVHSAIIHGELQEAAKLGRGGGMMLIPQSGDAGGVSEVAGNPPATSGHFGLEVAEEAPATSGHFGHFDAIAGNDGEKKWPEEVAGNPPATSTERECPKTEDS